MGKYNSLSFKEELDKELSIKRKSKRKLLYVALSFVAPLVALALFFVVVAQSGNTQALQINKIIGSPVPETVPKPVLDNSAKATTDVNSEPPAVIIPTSIDYTSPPVVYDTSYLDSLYSQITSQGSTSAANPSNVTPPMVSSGAAAAVPTCDTDLKDLYTATYQNAKQQAAFNHTQEVDSLSNKLGASGMINSGLGRQQLAALDQQYKLNSDTLYNDYVRRLESIHCA